MNKKKLIFFLHKHGWTQTWIAARMNLSVPRICQIITEYRTKNPKDHTMCEICNAPLEVQYILHVEDTKDFVICSQCHQTLEAAPYP